MGIEIFTQVAREKNLRIKKRRQKFWRFSLYKCFNRFFSEFPAQPCMASFIETPAIINPICSMVACPR